MEAFTPPENITGPDQLRAWLARAEAFGAYLIESRRRRWWNWRQHLLSSSEFYQKANGDYTFIPGPNRVVAGTVQHVYVGSYYDRDSDEQEHVYAMCFTMADGSQPSQELTQHLRDLYESEERRVNAVYQRHVHDLYPPSRGEYTIGRGAVEHALSGARETVARRIAEHERELAEEARREKERRYEEKCRKVYDMLRDEYTSRVGEKIKTTGGRIKSLDIRFRTFAALCLLQIPNVTVYRHGFRIGKSEWAWCYYQWAGSSLTHTEGAGDVIASEADVRSMWQDWYQSQFRDYSEREQQLASDYEQLRAAAQAVFK